MRAKSREHKQIKNIIIYAMIVIFGAFVALLEWLPITFSQDKLYDGLIGRTLQQLCGIVAAILLLYVMKIKLFGKPQKWLYLLPCVLVAVNNFQWWSYFNQLQELVRTKAGDILLFAFYCLCVGMFEEFIFRGVLFSVIASYFPQNKKGLIYTFVISSLLFGVAHIFNGNPLQVLYTVLTGGLFAFVLIKTKNLLCCGFIHGLYNFCGLLMDSEQHLGLGKGVALFEIGTVIMMAVGGVLMAGFVFFSLWKYPEQERITLYKRLAISPKKGNEENNVTVQPIEGEKSGENQEIPSLPSDNEEKDAYPCKTE